MTQAKRLYKPEPRPKLPRCCYIIKNGGYGQHVYGAQPDGSKQCAASASYEINGKPYCGSHGGKIALAILVGEDAETTTEQS